MRRITIVGGGQSGLQLGLGLLKKGNEVTVVSNRTGDDIYSGRVILYNQKRSGEKSSLKVSVRDSEGLFP